MRITLTNLFTLLLVSGPIVDGVLGGKHGGIAGILVGLLVGVVVATGNLLGFRAMLPRFVSWEEKHRIFTLLTGYATVIWIFGSSIFAMLVTQSIVH